MRPSRALLGWAERSAPALARAVAAPAVRGAASRRVPAGTEWTHPARPARARVVHLTTAPATARWIAGSLARDLGAVVVVPDAPEHGAEALAALERDLPLAVVGEGAACDAAAALARGRARRLALVAPPRLAAAVDGDWPTTLLQAAGDGEHRAAVVELERALRRAGVGVRETEYAGVDDDWARRPRVSRGASRALGDLVAFLDRGVGEAATFDVIPGWDLH